ncbi:hypothetical protein Tsubulata_024606 [Turnera subulata]|uniref:Uncharacterized protein n=1 Tax=Turnera subulata TaxID=218843 RepID=A0A9Q0FEK8_9ROSI|nr:hypothetical protein Tsubulata_024606 [Turnera subulata]
MLHSAGISTATTCFLDQNLLSRVPYIIWFIEIVFFSLPTPHHPPKKSPTLKSIDFPSLVLLLVSSPLPSLSLSSLLLPSYKNTRRRSRGELGGLKLATAPPSLGFGGFGRNMGASQGSKSSHDEMVGSTKTLKTKKKQPASEVNIARKNDMPDAGRFVLGCYTLAISKVLPEDLQEKEGDACGEKKVVPCVNSSWGKAMMAEGMSVAQGDSLGCNCWYGVQVQINEWKSLYN